MARLSHPREWPNRAWTAVLVLFMALLVVANRVDVITPSSDVTDAVVRFAPTVGVLVALASLVVTALSTAASWRRQKRQATIEAWMKWSDSNAESRALISERLGMKRISADQAVALTSGDTVVLQDKNGDPLSVQDKVKVGTAAVAMLNGLERLANGVALGVYDLTTLRKMGATIVVRTFERFEPYIEQLRNHPDPDRRQQKSYEALIGLVRTLRRYRLDEERLRELRMR